MAGPWRYLRAAFNLRPLGMPIPPNWMFLAGMAMFAALHSPAWLLIGAGVELTYLMSVISLPRFRKAVDAAARAASGEDWIERRTVILGGLDAPARRRQEGIEVLAREVAARDGADPPALARLVWVHLKLLDARKDLHRLVDTAEDPAELDRRIADLADRRAAADGDLADSLGSQHDLLLRRRDLIADARRRMAYIEAELERLDQQVRLLRDQSLAADGGVGAGRVLAELSAGLDATSRWMVESRQLFGSVDDVTATPSPTLLQTTPNERQTLRQ